MSTLKKGLIFLIPLLMLMVIVVPQQIKAATSPPDTGLPAVFAPQGIALPQTSALQETKIGSIPTEVPLPMMQFPPLNPYQFVPAQTMEIKPVENLVDGSKLYQKHCSDCHGQITTSHARGANFAEYTSAVKRKPQMKKVQSVDPREVRAILDALH